MSGIVLRVVVAVVVVVLEVVRPVQVTRRQHSRQGPDRSRTFHSRIPMFLFSRPNQNHPFGFILVAHVRAHERADAHIVAPSGPLGPSMP